QKSVQYRNNETAPAMCRKLKPSCRERKGKAAAPTRRRFPLTSERLLAEVVRHVVEGRVQLVADALHRSNRGDGDQRGNQAVLNRSCTLRILNQLQKLRHARLPYARNPHIHRIAHRRMEPTGRGTKATVRRAAEVL